MKPQSIIFKRPFKLVQLFRNINTYGKEEKSFEDRKEKLAWKPIQSTSGYLKDDVVHLPASVLAQTNFKNCDLIILVDDNFKEKQNVFYMDENMFCFQNKSAHELGFIQLKLDQKIELYLKHGYFEVGFPKRDNFKLCELIVHKPVAIKINGKRDFSAGGRRARTFVEQEYIFHYLGDFIHCEILKEPTIAVQKAIPIEYKIIDLLKPLW